MAASGDEEPPELTYYAGIYCNCCQKLDKMEFQKEYDDDDYLEPDDDFGGDETLMLHVIHYRRNLAVNGGADMELLAVDNAAVEGRIRRRFYMILRCRELETSDDDDDDGGSPDDDGKRKRSSGGAGKEEKIFRVVVACCWWRKSDMEVLVFKDSNWKNLLPCHPDFDRCTEPEPRRPPPS